MLSGDSDYTTATVRGISDMVRELRDNLRNQLRRILRADRSLILRRRPAAEPLEPRDVSEPAALTQLLLLHQAPERANHRPTLGASGEVPGDAFPGAPGRLPVRERSESE